MRSNREKYLYSLETEKACLGSAIKYQQELPDILPLIGVDDFYFSAHKTIYSCIKNLASDGKVFDTVLLTSQLQSLGLSNIDGIDIHDYVSSLANLDGVARASFYEHFKTLHKYYNARKLVDSAKEQIKFVEANLDKNSSDLIGGVEKIFASEVNTYQQDNEPIDLCASLKEEIEGRGNTPQEDGIVNPYEQFRRFFGNFLFGALYVFCAPAKNGKSTLLSDLAKKCTKKDEVKCLYLDTELTTIQQKNRLAASLSGVNEYYIRTGKYRLDAEMTRKVRAIWPTVEKMIGCMDHIYVAGKPIDEIVSMVRRWYFKNIRKGMKALIIYDYIKLTGEKVSDSWKEYQVIGEKATKLKDLAQELKSPILAAIQTNQGGNVAMSSQIKWFADLVAIFRKKEPDEIQKDGPQFGTHRMEITESRNQGEDAMGFTDIVKMPSGEYERFRLNFELKNFAVEEKGSLMDVAEFMANHSVKLADEVPEEEVPF
jgi:replicative DNA helicase